MATSLHRIGTSGGEYHAEDVLKDWLKSVNNFHGLYNQVNSYVAHLDFNTLKNNEYDGQCSVHTLFELREKMFVELKKLANDLDISNRDQPPTHEQSYEKLSRHIDILNNLSLKAQIILQLVSTSSS